MNTSMRMLLLMSIACCPPLAAAAPPGTLRTVALTGQPGTGAPGMAGFSFFSTSPALNAAGRTAFSASLTGGDINTENDTGIWSEGSGALALVAREGSQAPGAPAGTFFANLETPLLNAAGQTAFNSLIRGVGVTSGNDGSIWSELNGPLELLAREGSQAPGAPAGANYSFLGTVRLGDDRAAFFAGLQPSGGGVTTTNDSGIWSGGNGALNLVAREGSPAPGAPAGVLFNTFGDTTPALGAAGRSGFFGRLRPGVGGVTSSNDTGIWSEASGVLDLVAREGSQAPGAPIGGNFGDISSTFRTINGTGQVVFHANLQVGGGVTSSNDSGVWSQGSGVLALVAREGDPAPGAPVGSLFAQFDQFFQTPVLNAEGRTAFIGSLQIGPGGVTSSNNSGVWSDRSGVLQLVAREGSQAPGTPSGANFDFLAARSAASIVLNSAGQMAFLTSLQFGSGGVSSSNDRGLWAEDITGVLRLITREGDMLEVAPGDFRTVSSLSFRGDSGNEDGRGSGFNDLGQVAFGATFTNGTSGVFVSNLATLPEPTTLALAFVTAMLAAASTRRWRVR